MKNDNLQYGKFNLLARAIPALVVIGSVIALALWWTRNVQRGGIFFYFLLLMVYAVVMGFFSDVIFLGGKKPLHVVLPIKTVAFIHVIYTVAVIVLYLIFQNLPVIYFIIASIIATSVQVSLSLWIFLAAQNIEGQQKELDNTSNKWVIRDVQIDELRSAFSQSPLADDKVVMSKLNVLCNTWKHAAPHDTEHTRGVSAEIEEALQSLIDFAESEEATTDDALKKIEKAKKLVEKRATLLTLK